jgi:hypothetical protein
MKHFPRLAPAVTPFRRRRQSVYLLLQRAAKRDVPKVPRIQWRRWRRRPINIPKVNLTLGQRSIHIRASVLARTYVWGETS